MNKQDELNFVLDSLEEMSPWQLFLFSWSMTWIVTKAAYHTPTWKNLHLALSCFYDLIWWRIKPYALALTGMILVVGGLLTPHPLPAAAGLALIGAAWIMKR